jgi:TnpA family transposase
VKPCTSSTACNYETDLHIQDHLTHTHTHRHTTHVSGLCAALGSRSGPRIRHVLDQRPFTIRPSQDYGPFNQLLTDRVNTGLMKTTGT